MSHDIVQNRGQNTAVHDAVPSLMLRLECHAAGRAMVLAIVLEPEAQTYGIRLSADEAPIIPQRHLVALTQYVFSLSHRLDILPRDPFMRPLICNKLNLRGFSERAEVAQEALWFFGIKQMGFMLRRIPGTESGNRG